MQGVDGIEAFGLEKLVQIGASQLIDKLPASRDAARTLLLELQTVYEKTHVPEPTAVGVEVEEPTATGVEVEEPTVVAVENPPVSSWEHFCRSKLSPLSAQAVLRATNTAREGLVSSS